MTDRNNHQQHQQQQQQRSKGAGGVNQKMRILRKVVGGLRSSVGSSQKQELGIEETLRPEHFQVAKTVRHGFPFHPTAIAHDPVQNLLAVGTRTGTVRIFGRPEVQCDVKHEGRFAITQLIFLINEGALISICADDQLHMWTLRQKKPEIVHSLKFQREKITRSHLPFQSKWLYVGTERGNVHVVNLETFTLSGYVINWNKAMELIRMQHPGAIVHLSDNPMDSNKLLIGFELGPVVLWDLKNKTADLRFTCTETLRSVSWHHEGKQFICSHGDGSLTIWNCKAPQKPQSYLMPHAKLAKDGKPEPCKPITKADYRSNRNSEAYILFSGGTPLVSPTPSLTVMQGNNMTVLEMEHAVIDFVTLCSTPYNNEFQDAFAIVVLLENDLVVVDLNSPGYPCFENPYAMDIHDSPVTVCAYFADCSPDLIGAYCWVGSKTKRTGYSDKKWPINGGEQKEVGCSTSEIVITGHADGSLKFWDASGATFQVLYKLKTAKVFDPSKNRCSEDDECPFAVQHIHLCVESRLLCVAGFSHVILYRFNTQETLLDVPFLEVTIEYEINDSSDSPELEFPIIFPAKQSGGGATGSGSQHTGSGAGQTGNSASSNGKETVTSVQVRPGVRKWPAGYQPDLCCLLTWIDREAPPPITSLSVNSRFGLLTFGDECGIAIVDILQKTCLLSMGTPDLYGSMDPYSRAPRSPKLKSQTKLSAFDFSSQGMAVDDCKSPAVEQFPLDSHDSTAASNSRESDNNSRLCPTPTPGGVVTLAKPRSFGSGLESIQESLGTYDTTGDPDLHSGSSRPRVELSLALGGGGGGKGRRRGGVTEPSTAAAVMTGFGFGGSGSSPLDPTAPDTGLRLEQRPFFRKASAGLDHHHHHHHPRDSSTGRGVVRSSSSLLHRLSHRNRRREAFSASKSLSDETFAPCGSEPDGTGTQVIARSNDGLGEGAASTSSSSSEPSAGLRRSQSSRKSSRSDQDDGSLSDGGRQKKGGGGEGNAGLVRMFSERFLQGGRPEAVRNRHLPKVKVLDLTDDDPDSSGTLRKLAYPECCTLDRIESSFSRSHSSSTTSLENVNKEAIECLVFADAFARKSEALTSPCLWVGTSLGTVLVVSLSLPTDVEVRRHEPVIVSPSGTIFRLKGAILAMSFLDCNGILIPTIAEQWKDATRDDNRTYNRQQSCLSGRTRVSPSSSVEASSAAIDRQFAIICSERQARVISLPSQTCAYKAKITDTSSVARADVITMRDSACLACYIANGHLMAFVLPSLKLLLDIDFVPSPDIRVARTLCFGSNGSVTYMCTPTEIQKLTLSAEAWETWKDTVGDVFLPCNMPEAPKQGFFKNLFVGTPMTIDREELFGEGSGRASKTLTKYTPGPAGLQDSATLATSEIGRAKLAALERGERLGELEERTEKMKLDAEQYAQSAHMLKMKYNKKWYQF